MRIRSTVNAAVLEREHPDKSIFTWKGISGLTVTHTDLRSRVE